MLDNRTLNESAQISYRLDLGPLAPIYVQLQRLFYDLYVHRRQEPSHVFMAKHDVCALTHQIRTNMDLTRFRYSDIERFGLGIVEQIYNETTGDKVHIVILPDLEPGTVILGFFR